MPSNSNAVGNLEISDAGISPGFMALLNDRLRRIGLALAVLKSGQPWQIWRPTIVPAGSMTATAAAGVTALYVVVGSVCFFRLRFTTTLGGAMAASLMVTGLPIPEILGFPFACGGTVSDAVAGCSISGMAITISSADGVTAFTSGSTTFSCSGAFQSS